MRVVRLKLANVRAIEVAELRFRPGFNLVVGVNGVGKTTVLDALAVCLSDVVRLANAHRSRVSRVVPFKTGDIRVGADALDVACDIENGEENERHGYALHKPRESAAPRAKQAGRPREQVHDTPEKAGFIGKAPRVATGNEPEGRPLAVLFSTNRAVPSERGRAAAGGVGAAFSSALSDRQLRLGELAAWMRAQQALSAERPAAGRVLDAFDRAVTRFLPRYRNLRPDEAGERGGSLLIDRDDTTLPVKLLSDGERGVLAMVLDLTRRLAQANPEMEDPAAEAEAVILIDEIELHLHPAWQRRIVANLTRTFPKCQFIATTHSPQVIGEVEHGRIHIVADGQVYSPSHSFGVDSSRVLEEIMDTTPRTEDVKALLLEISRTIRDDRYDAARELLVELSRHLGENDPEVTRIQTLLDFMTSDA